MRSKYLSMLVVAGLISVARVSALPTLQLDAVGGVYDPGSETTISAGSVFDLRALFQGTLDPARTYFISAAIVPNPGYSDPAPGFGSVLINGTSYDSGDFLYGTPPADVLDTSSKNLASHGVFPTYYLELAFNFDAAHTVAAYNVQDDSAGPGLLYYKDFAIDVTGLAAGYYLHFDLYNEKVKKGEWVVDDFAPFSHDAESNHRIPDGGATVGLLGFAVLALGFASVKLNQVKALRITR